MLRILLSLAMLLPGGPPPVDCGDCPFTSVEECRAWLASCCDAGDRVGELCGAVEPEQADTSDCGSACGDADTSISCCSAEPATDEDASPETQREAGSDVARDPPEAGTTCCKSATVCDATPVKMPAEAGCCGDSDSESPVAAGPACPGHSRGNTGQPNCDWCCCCPMRPSRAPDRPQAPLPVRSSVEKEKAANAAIVGAVQATVSSSVQRASQAPVSVPVPSNSRQSVLCVWRE